MIVEQNSYPDPDASPGYQLWLVSNLWQRKVRAILEPLELTHTQFVVLAVVGWLDEEDAPVTQAAVARRAGIDEMMTSQVVRTLEDRELLERGKHPTDARARTLALTPSGEETLISARTIVRDKMHTFFGLLSSKERAQLTQLLAKLGRHFNEQQ